MTLYPVILAGGLGTRMWPLSREPYPRQFLNLTKESSLLQETISRIDGIKDVSPPLIVCNEEHRFLVAEHVRQLGKTPLYIALEPEGKSTAPALTLAALMLRESSTDDSTMLVMPADHIIQDVSAFQDVVRKGAAMASVGKLVTFGIVPQYPETGYGYIKKGNKIAGDDEAFSVANFIEKPDMVSAQLMLEAKDYLWNSGIFMMKPSVWLEQIERYRPDIAKVCADAHAKCQRDGDFYRPDAKIFSSCPSESIDYAVMESSNQKTSSDGEGPDCVVLPLDIGWSDLGAWSALWGEGETDDDGNVKQGDVYTHSVKNSVLLSQSRLLAAVGLEDVVAIETSDGVFVAHKDQVHDIKTLVGQAKLEGIAEQNDHRRVHRPWGTSQDIEFGTNFRMRRLTINPHAVISLQLHYHRSEHWVVLEGSVKVNRGDEEFLLNANQSIYVPPGTEHQLENPGNTPTTLIEIQTGGYLDENDILRISD